MPREIYSPRDLDSIKEKGIIRKLFDRIKNLLLFVFVREWEDYDYDTKRYKEKGFSDVDYLRDSWKRNINKFFKDYEYTKRK